MEKSIIQVFMVFRYVALPRHLICVRLTGIVSRDKGKGS